MTANNEIGALQPIREIGELCHERGVLFHTDAVQAIGKVPFNVIQDNVDLASITGPQAVRPQGCRRACTFAARIRACSLSRRSTAAATSAACVPAR